MNPDELIDHLKTWAYNERPGSHHGVDDDYQHGLMDGEDQILDSLQAELARLKEKIKRDPIGRYGSITNA